MTDYQPDTQPDSPQNPVDFKKTYIAELKEKYKIGPDPLYTRMRYLQITTYRDNGGKGKAYLLPDQVSEMDGLHEHIKTNGRMEGYPVPMASGPERGLVQPGGAIATTTTQQIVEQSAGRGYAEEIEPVNPLVVSAQNRAAGTLIAEAKLAALYIENPGLLPEHLQEQILKAREVQPVDPLELANSLVNSAKASGAGL